MSNVIVRLNFSPITGANNATSVTYDNDASGLLATNVQDAIDEVVVDISDEVTRASAAEGALQVEIDAEEVRALAAEDALQDDVDQVIADLTAHIADVTDAHDASSISSVPAGNLAATEVQAALDELQTDVDTRALDSALSSEVTRATTAETTLQTNITTEASTRATADTTLQTNIDAEETRALAAEVVLQDNIDDHIADTSDAHNASAISYDETIENRLTSTNSQDAIDELALRAKPSDGDIEETPFVLASAQTDVAVTGLYFNPANIRSFEVLLSLEVDSLYETVKITGVQKAADFVVSIKSTGDVSGVTFDITTLGQVTYSSPVIVSGLVTFRAIVLNT